MNVVVETDHIFESDPGWLIAGQVIVLPNNVYHRIYRKGDGFWMWLRHALGFH